MQTLLFLYSIIFRRPLQGAFRMFIECSSFERGKTAEHELFIGLHARLVEGVHPEDTAGDAASQLVEIE